MISKMLNEDKMAQKMETPPEVELRLSGVQEGSIGIWCKSSIEKGKKFGPFVGDKVLQSDSSMDSTYVWEIVDVETLEFLFYIDATNPEKGNWMRYINCARYYEEQNIVSQQEGIDIYYTAIKDIGVGEELLTWYESKPLLPNNKPRRPKKPKVSKSPLSSPEKKNSITSAFVKKSAKSADVSVTKFTPKDVSDKKKVIKKRKKNSTNPGKNASSESIGNSLKSSKMDSNDSGIMDEPDLNCNEEKAARCFHEISKTGDVIKLGTEHKLEHSELDDVDTGVSEQNVNIKEDIAEKMSPDKTEIPVAIATTEDRLENSENSDVGDEAQNEPQGNAQDNTVVTTTTDVCCASSDKNGKSAEITAAGFYQFTLLPCHVTMGKTGRKVYRCDICSGDYRHAFSLKRHYIRSHINYKYVSETDLMNCNISKEQQEVIAKRVDAANVDENKVHPFQNGHDQSKHKRDSDEMCDKQTKTLEQTAKNDGIAEDHGTVEHAGMETESSSYTKEPKHNLCILNIPKQFKQSHDNDNIGIQNDLDTKDRTVKLTKCVDYDKHDRKTANSTDKFRTEDLKTDDEIPHDKTKPLPASFMGPWVSGLYHCNICHKLFHTRDMLKAHTIDHPKLAAQLKFSCDQCDMTFSHKRNLFKHQAVHAHPGIKQFTCVYCGKIFSSLTNQKRHERTHQGQKFSCEYCQRTFTQSSDLKKHMRCFHAEHYFECSFCGKNLSSKNELNEHVTIHQDSPQSSESLLPEKKTQSLRDLQTNESMQSDGTVSLKEERNPDVKFLCSVCWKDFSDYQLLCHHQRIAHQHSILHPQQIRKDNALDEIITVERSTSDSTQVQDFEAQVTFYENVARNIGDNLNNYIDGKEEHLENYKVHVKCEVDETPAEKVETDSLEKNLSKYNFPPGYHLSQNIKVADSEPAEAVRPKTETETTENSVYDTCKHGKRQIENIKSKHQVQPVVKTHESLSREAPVLYSMICSNNLPANAYAGSTAISTPPPPPPPPPLVRKPEQNKVPSISSNLSKPTTIRVPQIHTCLRCKCIFHNAAVYADHMLERHNISVNMKEVNTLNPAPGFVADSSVLSPGGAAQASSFKKVITSSLGIPTVSPLHCSNTDVMDLSTSTTKSKSTSFVIGGAQGEGTFSQSLDLTQNTVCRDLSPDNRSNDIDRNTDDSSHKGNYHRSDSTKFVCSVCDDEFHSVDEIVSHQKKDHRSIICTYVEVDKNFAVPLAYRPSAFGILGSVVAVSLPTTSETVNPEQTLTCTKCMQTFEDTPQFHKHILDCAGHWKKRASKTKRRKHKKRMKTVGKTSSNGSQSVPEITDESSQDVVQMKYKKGISRQQFKKSRKRKLEVSEVMELESEVPEIMEDEASQKRRRNLELLYNPQNHTRRREFINVLDMHKCNGCSLRFESISNLERHIKVCTKKERLKMMPDMKTSFTTSSHENKLMQHKCKYCDKQFTYHGSLRKHVNSSCAVRKYMSENGHIADYEWKEPEYDETQGNSIIPENTSQNAESVDGESKEKGRVGWPKGRKRKGKRRNHGWGYSRKKLLCESESSTAQNCGGLNTENMEDLPSSLEASSKTSDSLRSSNSSSKLDFVDSYVEDQETMNTNRNDIETNHDVHSESKDKVSVLPCNEVKKKVKRKRKQKVVKVEEVKRKRRVNVQEENPYKRMYRRRSSTKTLDDGDQVVASVITDDKTNNVSVGQPTKRGKRRKPLEDTIVSIATNVTGVHGDKEENSSVVGGTKESNFLLSGKSSKKNIITINDHSASSVQTNDTNMKKMKKKKKKKKKNKPPPTDTDKVKVHDDVTGSYEVKGHGEVKCSDEVKGQGEETGSDEVKGHDEVTCSDEVKVHSKVSLSNGDSPEQDEIYHCVLGPKTFTADEVPTKDVFMSSCPQNPSKVSAASNAERVSSLTLVPPGNYGTSNKTDSLMNEAKSSSTETLYQSDISDSLNDIPDLINVTSKQDLCFENHTKSIAEPEHNMLNLSKDIWKPDLGAPTLTKVTSKEDTLYPDLLNGMPSLTKETSKKDLKIPSLAAGIISIPCAD